MRRNILIVALLVLMLALAGCGGSDGDEGTTTTEADESEGVSHQVMEMGANEQAVFDLMPAYVDEDYVGWAEEQGDVEGEDYLDVRGIEPVFVGYEVVVWRPADDAEYVERLEMPYLNGHIAAGYASPDTEETGMPSQDEAHVMNIDHVTEASSEGEKSAISAAEAKLAEVAADFAYEGIGVNRYLFLYEKDGMGVVIGLTGDGVLGSNSMPFELAQ